MSGATPHYRARTASLPAVPAATTTTGSDGTHGKSEKPDSQHDHGNDPQGLQCEAGTEEKQGEQKNEKQGNHSYQPPEHRVPWHNPAMHPIFMCFLFLDMGMRYRPRASRTSNERQTTGRIRCPSRPAHYEATVADLPR